MKTSVQEIREGYETNSAMAGKASRQASYVGAVIGLLMVGILHIPVWAHTVIFLSVVMFMLSVMFGLIQYLYGAVMLYAVYNKAYENRKDAIENQGESYVKLSDSEFKENDNRWTWRFWRWKVCLSFTGWLGLLAAFVSVVFVE